MGFYSIRVWVHLCTHGFTNGEKVVPIGFMGMGSVGEEISPARWRIAPTLNPKKRRGLSVLLVARLVDKHTRAREGLEWFGPPERNILLHCVMYCLRACMNL
jgi:hypothetical protein